LQRCCQAVCRRLVAPPPPPHTLSARVAVTNRLPAQALVWFDKFIILNYSWKLISRRILHALHYSDSENMRWFLITLTLMTSCLDLFFDYFLYM
jgi:hypothetical protein